MYAIYLPARDHNQDESSGHESGEYDRFFDRDTAETVCDQLISLGHKAFVARV